jgi:hypothetical protein
MSEHIGKSQEIDRTEGECSLSHEGRQAMLVTPVTIRKMTTDRKSIGESVRKSFPR